MNNGHVVIGLTMYRYAHTATEPEVATVTTNCESNLIEKDPVVPMETKSSRKGLLKAMKIREARKHKRKTKRLGGKKSHSKW